MIDVNRLEGVARASCALDLGDQGTGSGMVISHLGDHSYVLTCEHVVGAERKARVIYRVGGRFFHVDGIVERTDKAKDLAIVRTQRMKTLTIGIAKNDPSLYERVYTVGSPEGYFGTICEGILTGIDGSNGQKEKLYQISAYTSDGGSGSGVVNSDGELVGVVQSVPAKGGYADVRGIVFAAPLDAVQEFLGPDAKRAITRRRRRACK